MYSCCLPISSSNQYRWSLCFRVSLFLQLVQLGAVAPSNAPSGAGRAKPQMSTPLGSRLPKAQMSRWGWSSGGCFSRDRWGWGYSGHCSGGVFHIENGSGCRLGHRSSFPEELLLKPLLLSLPVGGSCSPSHFSFLIKTNLSRCS